MQAHGRGFEREVEIVAFRRRAQADASRLKPAGSRRGAALGVITRRRVAVQLACAWST